MKQVVQLTEEGYFHSVVQADESPLEPGVYLIPRNCIETEPPEVPSGMVAKWNGGWVFEEKAPDPESLPKPGDDNFDPYADWTWEMFRANEYPSMSEYLDGIVKGDQAQIDKYIADCLAVKAKYPKE